MAIYSPIIPKLIIIKLPITSRQIIKVTKPETALLFANEINASAITKKLNRRVEKPRMVMILKGKDVNEVSAVIASSNSLIKRLVRLKKIFQQITKKTINIMKLNSC